MRWPANEDCELSARITAAGGIVARVNARARKIITRGPLAALLQWSRYGFWRAQTIKAHPKVLRPRHLAPPIALLFALTLLASPARVFVVPAYLLYAIAIVLGRARDERPLVTLATLIYFPLFHCGYGLGILCGLLTNRIPRARDERAAVAAEAV